MHDVKFKVARVTVADGEARKPCFGLKCTPATIAAAAATAATAAAAAIGTATATATSTGTRTSKYSS